MKKKENVQNRNENKRKEKQITDKERNTGIYI